MKALAEKMHAQYQQFLTPEQRMKKLVLAVPDFIPPENGKAEVRNAEDYQTCSYFYWRT